jgi:hypothetical protein
MKRFARLFLCLVMAAVWIGISALTVTAQESFTITNYSIHVVIDQHNVYQVSETIEVDFTSPRHGIYRKIPIRGTLYRDSPAYGYKESKLMSSVSDVQVEGFPFSVDREGDDVVIAIGDADKLVEGHQVYYLSYRLNMGNDRITEYDEVYYNLIGTGWDTTIDKADFTVELPQAFDASLLGFAAGQAGSQITGIARIQRLSKLLQACDILIRNEATTVRRKIQQQAAAATDTGIVDAQQLIQGPGLFLRVMEPARAQRNIDFRGPPLGSIRFTPSQAVQIIHFTRIDAFGMHLCPAGCRGVPRLVAHPADIRAGDGDQRTGPCGGRKSWA